MRRVWLVYWLRRLTRPFMLKAYVFCAAALAAVSFVSLANVFYNMPSVTDIYGTYTFWSNAVLYTEMHVQVLLLITIAAFVFFTRDLIHAAFAGSTPARAS